MNRIHPLAVLSTLGAVAALTSGCGSQSHANAKKPTAQAAVSVQLERVTAGHPVRKTLTLETIQPGWIKPFEETPLVSKVSGYVAAVHVDLGDRVTTGQILIEISAPELLDEVRQKQAQLAQAQAELRQAKSSIVAARAALRTIEAMVASAKAGMERAQGEFERWNAEYDRLKELADRGSVTGKLVDETRNQLQSAQAARSEAQAIIQSAEAAVDEAIANVGKAEADKGAAEARCQVAEANLAYAKTISEYTRIKAPFAGVITERNVDTGRFVHPAEGQSAPLLVVARTDLVRVFLDVPETEAEWVTGGTDEPDPAVVTVPAMSNRHFEGFVTRTSWSLNPTNRSLRTEVDLSNEHGLLRPGVYTSVRLRLHQRENVLTLPAAAIVHSIAGPQCCLLIDGKVRRQPVGLGLRVGDEYEVTSGVQEQDLVILARGSSLEDGQAVERVSVESK